MKRRDFVTQIALGATLGGTLAACQKQQSDAKKPSAAPPPRDKKVLWRLASSFPRGLDTIYGAAETLSRQVEAMSGGNFRIRCYPAGEIVPGLQVMDAAQQGTVQVGHTAGYYYVGKHPAFAFDTAVPYGLSGRQQVAWLLEGGGEQALAPLFADFNLVRFFGGCTGAQMGGWFKRPVESVGDLKGLKMRIPGLGGDVMSRLGVTVQVLAGGDIYPALERGAIDATEWIGPYDDEKLGFFKVAQHYYYPGWWEPGPSLSYYVNKRAWESLSREHQAMFSEAAHVSGLRMQAQYDARNPAALTRLRKHKINVQPFPDSVMVEAEKHARDLLEGHAAEDPSYRRIYEPWNKYRMESREWFATAELAFASFAFKPG